MWWVGVSTVQGRTSVSLLESTLLSALVFPHFHSQHGICFLLYEMAVWDVC